MILEIKDLRVSFQKAGATTRQAAFVVQQVNLSVNEGSWTSLVGESGSGKTVTALSICRLLKAYFLEGEIHFYSKEGKRTELLTLQENELLKIRGKAIGYVFQDPASCLNPLLRIGHQIKEATLAHFDEGESAAVKKTKEMLEAISIGDAERVYASYPHELSGGMKQRVMIAMALMMQPRLLIADEPTSSLDAVTEKEIIELLLKIKSEKPLSIFFITHNLPLALACSDRIYVMQQGAIIEKLEKDNGFEPTQPYTQKLFNARLSNAKPKQLIEI